MKEFLDLIPLIAFFVIAKMYGVVEGAGALLVATVIVYGVHFFRQDKKLNKQQWVILILTVVFCGFTLLFNDDYYVKIKSPIINGVFALALIISVVVNKPLIKMAFKHVFVLSDKGWKNLTLVWAGFFVLMAIAHYYTAFYMSNEIWINFKTWGGIPIMLIFMLGQFIFLRKHINKERLEQAQKEKNIN